MDQNINEFLLSFKLVMHWTMFLATVMKWNNKDNNTYHPDCVSITEDTEHLAVQVTWLRIPIPSSGFCLALDYWPQPRLLPVAASAAWVLHVDFHFLVRRSSGPLSSSLSFILGSEWAFSLHSGCSSGRSEMQLLPCLHTHPSLQWVPRAIPTKTPLCCCHLTPGASNSFLWDLPTAYS